MTEEGFIVEASIEEKYNFVIKATEGKMEFENIKDWITENISKV